MLAFGKDGNDNARQDENGQQRFSAQTEGEKKAASHDEQENRSQLAPGRCHSLKSNGMQCTAYAQHDSFYCFIHDPARSQERHEARVNGGKVRSRKAAVLPPETPNRPLASAADVTGLMAETINHALRGEVDPRVCNAVGYLAQILLKSKQQDEVEQRLQRVESILARKWADPDAIQPRPELPSFEFVNPKQGGQA